MVDGKIQVITANKLVAKAWLLGYEEDDCIIHKDGNIHNLHSDNLSLCGKDEYTKNKLRNAKNKVCLSDRITKLKTFISDAEATLHLFEKNDWNKVHQRVNKYLVQCLMRYGTNTLHLSRRTTSEQVPEVIAHLYMCLDLGYCVYNYERYCKRLLLNYKRMGSFGKEGHLPNRDIRNVLNKNDIKSLIEKFN